MFVKTFFYYFTRNTSWAESEVRHSYDSCFLSGSGFFWQAG